jgi:DNA-binding NarL/FixJ family response regulator
MAKTTLIADDHPNVRKLLCELFESEHGYDICAEGANGQEAIDLALKHRPDRIILDFAMPVMHGLTAAKELKKLRPDVQIVPFTLYAELAKQLLGTNLSVDRVVSKTETIELVAHVRSLSPN